MKIFFQNFTNPRYKFVALLKSTSYKTFARSLKAAPVAAILVNSYFRSKSVEYDVKSDVMRDRPVIP